MISKKPSFINYACAHAIWLPAAIGPICCMGFVTYYSLHHLPLIMNARLVIWLFIALVPGIPLSGIVSFLLLWPPFAWLATIINGRPFKEGDIVQILVGPYRNRRGQVYELWPERWELRVDLGTEAKESIKDVFSWNKVYKISD